MNWARRLDRAAALLRYHRPQQFFYRALRMAQRRLPSLSRDRSLDRLGPVRITDEAEGVLQRMAERRLRLWPARHDVEWLQNMSQGEFRFLNRTGTLAEQHRMPRLWRFHLQSQESLLELAEHVGAVHAWRLVADWLAEYPSPGRDADAWHPFCISRRLPVWLMLAARHGVPDSLQQEFWASVHRQTFWLSRNLEWDLGGNHLLENLRTLFVAKSVLGVQTGDGAGRGTTTNNANITNEESNGDAVAELAESFGGGPQSPKVLATSATDDLSDLRDVARWLQTQIDEQILPTGEHYERTPTYHCLMLLSLMEIDDVLPLLESSPPVSGTALAAGFNSHLQETIAKMQSFLASILHPDGMIPLFGDSVIDETPLPAVLIEPVDAELSGTALAAGLASGETRTTTNDTKGLSGRALAAGPDAGVKDRVRPEASAYGSPMADYWVDRSPPSDADTNGTALLAGSATDRFLIFDHGPLACDHLPAHGHADLLTFEASWAGRRFIVDRGTYDYEDSPERQLCRRTSGHNTLQIDGADHADVWSRFRMGRRGRVIDVRQGRDAESSWCLASHNAYARLGVPRVVRLIVSRRPSEAAGSEWLILDVAEAKGRHDYRSPLHLHPGWDIVEADRPGSWVCRPTASQPARDESGQSVRIDAITDCVEFCEQLGLEESFYAPNFGERSENTLITRRWKAEGLTWSAWSIGPRNVITVPAITVSQDVVRVEWAGWIREWVRNHE